ncbi:MAG: inositol monophosphatase family protein [Maritimibacter sp.]
MPERSDLELLMDAARQAGEISRGFFRRDVKAWEKPDSQGPVTECDLAVDEMLKDLLCTARPNYGWLSEETPDSTARLERETVFVIDPLDGTRAFIEGSPTWAHSLAVVHKGKPIAGVVYLPINDKLYVAARGEGAQLNGESLHASTRADLTGAKMLATRPSFEAHNWVDAQVPDVKRSHRSSLAYRMSLIAQGQYDAMLTLRATWEWDIAAGALIIEEAGGIATDRKGDSLEFNNPHPQVNGVVAAGAPLHASLRARIL